MADHGDIDPAPLPGGPERVPAGGRRHRVALVVVALLVVAGALAAVAGPSLRGDPSGGSASRVDATARLGDAEPSPTTDAGAGPAGSSGLSSPEALPSAAAPPGSSPGSSPGSGRIAIVRPNGAIAIVDDRGVGVVDLASDSIPFGPPAWAPDGRRLAAIGSGSEGGAIHVFDIPSDAHARPVSPPESWVVYDSADRAPFYLSWSPDGQRIGFLANDGQEITLRTAPAGGGASADGRARDGVLRTGAPLYFAWDGAQRLLLHVGSAGDAFTGVVDAGGTEHGAGLPGSGDFRAAVASQDGRFVAFVRGAAPAGAVVLAGPGGTSRATVPVLGPAAMAFQPGGHLLAIDAADQTQAGAVAFPLGPLRLVAPDGKATTLVDDPVVAFYWSPDGSTIAALRLVTAPGSTQAVRGGIALAAATPPPAPEVHLTFVAVPTGTVLSDRVVRLGSEYVSTILPYFDQYAMSHRVWSPDGSAIVLPLEEKDGSPAISVLGVDGDDRSIGTGIHATWAP